MFIGKHKVLSKKLCSENNIKAGIKCISQTRPYKKITWDIMGSQGKEVTLSDSCVEGLGLYA